MSIWSKIKRVLGLCEKAQPALWVVVDDWSDPIPLEEFSSMNPSDFPHTWAVMPGELCPLWFFSAVAEKKISVVGARTGDLDWGQDGVDVQTINGTVRASLGDTITFDGSVFAVTHNI